LNKKKQDLTCEADGPSITAARKEQCLFEKDPLTKIAVIGSPRQSQVHAGAKRLAHSEFTFDKRKAESHETVLALQMDLKEAQKEANEKVARTIKHRPRWNTLWYPSKSSSQANMFSLFHINNEI
jgi:hypothetical protein